MQPLKPQTYLVQTLLIVTATALMIFGFLFGSKSFTFHPAVFGYLSEGDFKQGIYLGIFPLSLLTTFVSYCLIYLLFEMYSMKNAVYAIFSIGVMMAATYALTLALKSGKSVATENGYDLLLNQLFVYRQRDVAANVAGWIAGGTFALTLAAFVKRATHNYFMFFRFLIATPVGFAVAVALSTYLLNFDRHPIKIMIVLAAQPLAQYIGLSIICLPMLYFVRLILGIFRGRLPKASKIVSASAANQTEAQSPITAPKTEDSSPAKTPKPKKKWLFRAETPALPPSAPKDEPAKPAEPTAPTTVTSAPPANKDTIKVYDLSECDEDEVSISALFPAKHH